MHTQAYPKACSPTPSQIHLQTLLYLLLVYHLAPSPAFSQAHFLSSDPRRFILVSSDHTTLFQSSRVQSLCLIAKSILSLLCFCDRWDFSFFTTAFIPVLLRCLCTVCAVTGLLVIVWSAFGHLYCCFSLPRGNKLD